MKRLFDGAGNVGEEVSVDADAPVPVRVQRAAARWRVVQLKGVESAGNGEGLDLVNGGGQDARRAFGLLDRDDRHFGAVSHVDLDRFGQIADSAVLEDDGSP